VRRKGRGRGLGEGYVLVSIDWDVVWRKRQRGYLNYAPV
jgi:hypothetical protein